MTPIDLSQVRLRSGREEEEEDEDVNEDPEHDGADEDEQMDQEMDEYDDYDDYDDRDESDLDPDERYITVRARRRLASIWASPDRFGAAALH